MVVIFFKHFEEVILLSSDFVSLCTSLLSRNLAKILVAFKQTFFPLALLVVVGKKFGLIQVVYHSQKPAAKISLLSKA